MITDVSSLFFLDLPPLRIVDAGAAAFDLSLSLNVRRRRHRNYYICRHGCCHFLQSASVRPSVHIFTSSGFLKRIQRVYERRRTRRLIYATASSQRCQDWIDVLHGSLNCY